jgi:hypothetical protein
VAKVVVADGSSALTRESRLARRLPEGHTVAGRPAALHTWEEVACFRADGIESFARPFGQRDLASIARLVRLTADLQCRGSATIVVRRSQRTERLRAQTSLPERLVVRARWAISSRALGQLRDDRLRLIGSKADPAADLTSRVVGLPGGLGRGCLHSGELAVEQVALLDAPGEEATQCRELLQHRLALHVAQARAHVVRAARTRDALERAEERHVMRMRVHLIVFDRLAAQLAREAHDPLREQDIERETYSLPLRSRLELSPATGNNLGVDARRLRLSCSRIFFSCGLKVALALVMEVDVVVRGARALLELPTLCMSTHRSRSSIA